MDIITARKQIRETMLIKIRNLLNKAKENKVKLDYKRLILELMDKFKISNRTARELTGLAMFQIKTTREEICLPTCQMQTMLKGGRKNTAS